MLKSLARIFIEPSFINITTKEDLLSLVKQVLRGKMKALPIICFYLNVGFFYHTLNDKDFQKATSVANFFHLNSFYLGWLLRILHGRGPSKLNAEDFVYDLFFTCSELRKRVFLLGSTPEAIPVALKNITSLYPNLQILGHHGYYRRENQVIKKILVSSPDVLLVGLGFGNQEKWVMRNKDTLKGVKFIITIGNFIDILGGSRKLPPAWFKKNNVEWLWRLLHEPMRLWKRYILGGLFATLAFLYTIVIKRNER